MGGALVLLASMPPDERLINFYFHGIRTAYLVHRAVTKVFLHSKSDAMEHEPCSLLRDTQNCGESRKN